MEFNLKSYGRSDEEKKHDRSLEQQWMSKHNFNQWYEILGNETFESIMIDITQQQASVLALLYKINQQKHKIDEKEQEQLNNTIQQLKNKITETLENSNSFQHNNGYFVRLSSRSPKDAAMEQPYLSKTQQLMYMDLKQQKQYNDNLNNNTISYLQSCMDVIKVTNSDEIICLLSNSRRVYEDINMFECKGLKLIIREWNDIVLGSEYRGFIGKNGELNALCQYFSFLYFEQVKRNKDKIKNAILKYYNEKIKCKLFEKQLCPCVIDFVIMNQNEFINKNVNVNVKVIELNIFHDYDDKVMIQSGSELFDWKKDKVVLLNGPFEFRILDNIPDDEYVERFIGPDWNNINAVVTRFKNDMAKSKPEKSNNCCVL